MDIFSSIPLVPDDAISRRATLFEMIMDYGQAANDTQKLVDLLTRQMEKAAGACDRSTSLANDLRQVLLRLSELEEKSRRGIPFDMYLIMGVETSCSASDTRKADRKVALRHHPDNVFRMLNFATSHVIEFNDTHSMLKEWCDKDKGI